MKPLEIERKLLIRMPDQNTLLLQEDVTLSHIRQTYLKTDLPLTTERVRLRQGDGVTVYTHTTKTRLTALTCIEEETEISQEAYQELQKRADPACIPVEKDRFCIRMNGYCYEIDIYPFWNDRAILEVELASEDGQFPIPPFLSVIKDVTADKRYKNAMLAKSIPYEQLP